MTLSMVTSPRLLLRACPKCHTGALYPERDPDVKGCWSCLSCGFIVWPATVQPVHGGNLASTAKSASKRR
jgi:ribosomal protein L37AE/L43A